MYLRPHHLLCTQSYHGMGYSCSFVKNMDRLTEILREDPSARVTLTFSCDSLCACCPEKQDPDLCLHDRKVRILDKKMISYFHLEEKTYRYKNLIHSINAALTPEILEDICGTCSWYHTAGCRELLLSQNSLQSDGSTPHTRESR